MKFILVPVNWILGLFLLGVIVFGIAAFYTISITVVAVYSVAIGHNWVAGCIVLCILVGYWASDKKPTSRPDHTLY